MRCGGATARAGAEAKRSDDDGWRERARKQAAMRNEMRVVPFVQSRQVRIGRVDGGASWVRRAVICNGKV